jgi:outer membrane protein with beta-barrel domain
VTIVRGAGTLLLVLLSTREAAAADHFVAAFVGATARTETGFIDLEGAASTRKPAVGMAAGWWSRSWFGIEGEVTLLPAFFETDVGLVVSSRVITANGNVLLSPWRTGRVQPYATIGAGVMSVRISDVADVFPTDANLAAINGGAGVIGTVRPRFAVRGDLRYFRSRFDESPAGAPALGARFLHSWRISAGIVVRY